MPCRRPSTGRAIGLGDRIAECTCAPLRAPCAVSQRFPWLCRVYIVTQPSSQAACLSPYAHSYRDTVPQQPDPRACAACPCARAGRIAAILGRVVASPHRIVAAAVDVLLALLRANPAMSWPPGYSQASLPASVPRYN